MRRTRIAVLAGCLLVAGGAGAGTASGDEAGNRPPVWVSAQRAERTPDFPGPDPRMVEPDRRAPGTIPHVVPEDIPAVPMPQLRHGPRSRPVPMPQLEELAVPPRGSLLPPGTVLRGGSQSPGD